MEEYLSGVDLANPCINCGACCATFRVSFYWAESDLVTPTGVPDSLLEKLDYSRMVMRGTNQKNPYCVALTGVLGESVACSIYSHRPSPCREFQAGEARCLEARAKHGINQPVHGICA